MKKVFLCSILSAVLALSGCAAGGQSSAAPEPESSPSSVSEPASSVPASPEPSAPEPEPSSAPEEDLSDEEDFPDADPDPGVDLPNADPEGIRRVKLDAMVAYLQANLDTWYYAEIQGISSYTDFDDFFVQVNTPFPDEVKKVVEQYTGDPVEVRYDPALFSIGQIKQAVKDAERFLAENPDVQVERVLEKPFCNGVWVETGVDGQEKLTAFLEGYSIANIYELQIITGDNQDALHPD